MNLKGISINEHRDRINSFTEAFLFSLLKKKKKSALILGNHVCVGYHMTVIDLFTTNIWKLK